MKTFLFALLLPATMVNASSEMMMQDPCKLPLNHPNSHLCVTGPTGFEYKESIWEKEQQEEKYDPLFHDKGRKPSDKEWSEMDITDKMMNEKRNDCAKRDERDCIVFDND